MNRIVQRSLSILLLVAGLGWVAYLLFVNLKSPAELMPEDGFSLAMATLLLTTSLATNLGVFHLFLNMQHPVPWAMSARLHLMGQLLRYLPGRVWGIVYQIGSTRESVPAPAILRANLDMMIFMLLGNSACALIILGLRSGQPLIWLSAAALVLAVITLLLLKGCAYDLLRWASSVMPRRASVTLQAIAEKPIDQDRLPSIVGLFLLGWCLYIAAWDMLDLAYPQYAEVDLLSLCAIYTLASTIGIILPITPAGLGIREGAFVILSTTYAHMHTVAFLAIFGRVWLLVAELILLPLFIVAVNQTNKS